MNFEPHPALRHPFLQTVAARWTPCGPLAPQKTLIVDVSGGDQVAVLVNHPTGPRRFSSVISARPASTAAVVLVPGLVGTARSAIMNRLARKFLATGFSVFRINPRGIGEGVGLAREVYHAARSADILPVVKRVDAYCGHGVPLVLAGFSLGGNMILREAGRACAGVNIGLPSAVKGVVALSPIINLSNCARDFDRIYFGIVNRAVTGKLRRFVEERHRAHPHLGPVTFPRRMSLIEFELNYTVPESGYDDLDSYYEDASAASWLSSIEIPTSVIISRDDPLARHESFCYPDHLDALVTDQGGHLGFFSKAITPFRDHFWGDWMMVTKAMHLLTKATDITSQTRRSAA